MCIAFLSATLHHDEGESGLHCRRGLAGRRPVSCVHPKTPAAACVAQYSIICDIRKLQCHLSALSDFAISSASGDAGSTFSLPSFSMSFNVSSVAAIPIAVVSLLGVAWPGNGASLTATFPVPPRALFRLYDRVHRVSCASYYQLERGLWSSHMLWGRTRRALNKAAAEMIQHN